MQEFDDEMFQEYANPASFDGSSLTVVEYPNPILRAPNADITDFDDKFKDLCAEFFSIMYAANGVGIAAPQLGLNIRLFVYNPDPTAPGALRKLGERVVANPRILDYCQRLGTEIDIEGCLSSRAECCRGDIRRAREIDVEYQDERGRLKRKKLRGFEARVFQHELDHLEGILHIDRQSESDRRKIKPFLDVLVEQHGPGGALEPSKPLSSLQPPPMTDADAEVMPLKGSGVTGERDATAEAARSPASAGAVQAKAAKAAGFGVGGGSGGASRKKKPKRRKK
jgi:peptide deformylase